MDGKKRPQTPLPEKAVCERLSTTPKRLHEWFYRGCPWLNGKRLRRIVLGSAICCDAAEVKAVEASIKASRKLLRPSSSIAPLHRLAADEDVPYNTALRWCKSCRWYQNGNAIPHKVHIVELDNGRPGPRPVVFASRKAFAAAARNYHARSTATGPGSGLTAEDLRTLLRAIEKADGEKTAAAIGRLTGHTGCLVEAIAKKHSLPLKRTKSRGRLTSSEEKKLVKRIKDANGRLTVGTLAHSTSHCSATITRIAKKHGLPLADSERKRLTERQRSRIFRMIKSGMTASAIRRATGHDGRTVKDVARRNGVRVTRGRGGGGKLTPGEEKRIVELIRHADGTSTHFAIARATGHAPQTVIDVARRNVLPLKPVANRRGKPLPEAKERALAARIRSAGGRLTATELARQTGYASTTIQRVAQHNGASLARGRTRLTEEQLQSLRDALTQAKGLKTANQLSRETGHGPRTVERHARDWGIDLKPGHGRPVGQRKRRDAVPEKAGNVAATPDAIAAAVARQFALAGSKVKKAGGRPRDVKWDLFWLWYDAEQADRVIKGQREMKPADASRGYRRFVEQMAREENPPEHLASPAAAYRAALRSTDPKKRLKSDDRTWYPTNEVARDGLKKRRKRGR